MAKTYEQAMQEFETIYKDTLGYEPSIREYMEVSGVIRNIFNRYEVTELHIFTQQEFREYYNKNEDEPESCPDAYFEVNNNIYYFNTNTGIISE